MKGRLEKYNFKFNCIKDYYALISFRSTFYFYIIVMTFHKSFRKLIISRKESSNFSALVRNNNGNKNDVQASSRNQFISGYHLRGGGLPLP